MLPYSWFYFDMERKQMYRKNSCWCHDKLYCLVRNNFEIIRNSKNELVIKKCVKLKHYASYSHLFLTQPFPFTLRLVGCNNKSNTVYNNLFKTCLKVKFSLSSMRTVCFLLVLFCLYINVS